MQLLNKSSSYGWQNLLKPEDQRGTIEKMHGPAFSVEPLVYNPGWSPALLQEREDNQGKQV